MCNKRKNEDLIDIIAYMWAKKAFDKNPITYTHEEILKELGLVEEDLDLQEKEIYDR